MDRGKPLPPLTIGTGALLPTCPIGYAATKGEQVLCENCKTVIGVLKSDLEGSNTHRRWLPSYVDQLPTLTCCGDRKYEKYDTLSGTNRLYIKDRGWV